MRAKTQPIFLLESTIGEESAVFTIKGATHTVYDTKISAALRPECSCPDHQIHGNMCKHIFFVLEKILRYDDAQIHEAFGSPGAQCWDNTSKQIRERLGHLDAGVVADEAAVARYHQIVSSDGKVTHRNDECAVCLTDINETTPASGASGKKQDLQVCPTCLNAVHLICWKKWASVKGADRCVYCRSVVAAASVFGKWGVSLK